MFNRRVIEGNIRVLNFKPLDNRNGNYDIYMYDISTSKEKRITSNSSDSLRPAIYGNKIVWMDDRSGHYFDIYMYDISTKKEKRITTDGSNHQEPAIYGNKIVWMDNRNGVYDIYMERLKL